MAIAFEIADINMSRMMRAVVVPKYGTPDVVKVKQIPIPKPKSDQVLVKVAASSLNALDVRLVKADPFFIRLMFGLFAPKRFGPGVDIAGTVEAVGANVTKFKPGDEVFGNILEQGKGGRGLAEYCVCLEKSLLIKPNNLTFQEAAAVPLGAQTSVVGLRDYVKPGKKVLVTGSSGAVGCYAVQVAKAYGAHVTAVCSTAKVDFVKSLGPDKVLDYNKVDYFKTGDTYDIVFDTACYHSLYAGRDALNPNGVFLLVGGNIGKIIWSNFIKSWLQKDGKKFTNVSIDDDTTGLATVKELVEEGKIFPPVDKVYPLEQAAAAMWRMERREVKGKIVVSIE